MKTSELVSAVILKAEGKRRNLQFGDTKYQRIFNQANLFIDEWQREPNVDWSSLYEPSYGIGTISTTNSYALDLDEIQKLSDVPSDFVVIRKDNVEYPHVMVAADQLKQYSGSDACAQVSGELRFAKRFTTESPEFGGSIEVPVYLRAPLLKNDNSLVPVDDPIWLVTICAAYYALDDVMLKDKYSILLTAANQLMQKMIENNDGQMQMVNYAHIPGVSDA